MWSRALLGLGLTLSLGACATLPESIVNAELANVGAIDGDRGVRLSDITRAATCELYAALNDPLQTFEARILNDQVTLKFTFAEKDTRTFGLPTQDWLIPFSSTTATLGLPVTRAAATARTREVTVGPFTLSDIRTWSVPCSNHSNRDLQLSQSLRDFSDATREFNGVVGSSVHTIAFTLDNTATVSLGFKLTRVSFTPRLALTRQNVYTLQLTYAPK
ncbi:MAG: hypothetical protein KIT43_07890 [Bauldia sp.]|nr:hypothetical protein [Bauldia sp.]